MENQQALDALKVADQRITELCQMVCTLSGNPKKVRAEDYADKVRSAITKLALQKGANAYADGVEAAAKFLEQGWGQEYNATDFASMLRYRVKNQ